MKQNQGDKLLHAIYEFKADTDKTISYFCLRCFSRNTYTRQKTKDFVCRKCGEKTEISRFDELIDLISLPDESLTHTVK